MGIDRPWIVIAAMALVVMAIIGTLVGFDPGLRRSVQDFFGYGGPHRDDASGSRSLFHSGADISGVKNGETYSAYAARRDLTADDGFMGFPCIDGCDAVEEGYLWAESNRIRDAKMCVGSSWPFVEGCAAYVMRDEPRLN